MNKNNSKYQELIYYGNLILNQQLKVQNLNELNVNTNFNQKYTEQDLHFLQESAILNTYRVKYDNLLSKYNKEERKNEKHLDRSNS